MNFAPNDPDGSLGGPESLRLDVLPMPVRHQAARRGRKPWLDFSPPKSKENDRNDGPSKGPLSVLIPVYNEERTIDEVITRVLALGQLVREIVIVDDGSTDATAEIVAARSEIDPKVRFFRLPHNQGKTAAIRAALEMARGDVIIVQDADLEYDPAEIPQVIEPILCGVADAVYGSRFLVRKATRVLYFYHYLANVALTFLSNIFTNRNMTDIETAYKAFRAEVIKPLRLSSSGFGMEVEITALMCKTNARTYEVPISYYGRDYREGKKIGLKDGLAALWYIGFYNIIKPWTPAGRRYIRQVNDSLSRARIAVI